MKKIFAHIFILPLASWIFLSSCDSNVGPGNQVENAIAIAQILQNSPGTQECRLNSLDNSSGFFAANLVVSAPSQTGYGFTDSYCARNGVRGRGKFNGSLDVFTLGASGPGASIILSWSGKKVLNAAGIDFIVYENPFFIGGSVSNTYDNVFGEPVVVEVGNDLSKWCGWNPTYSLGTFSGNPVDWPRFAGLTPVAYNQDTNPMNLTDLFNTDVVNGGGGGDGFDLSDANFGNSGTNCSTAERDDIQNNGFLYIRLTTAKVSIGSLPIDAAHTNPDIDGVIAKSISP
ncbi:hypothetical protein CH373_01275 [Leptospira perolatii]|uniref:LIC_13355 family lipoprotein n=1 Tax=Leptospira perolatii TaxID=2023191 RepID=A0A2M9ZRJ9_9LEPT|nr:LIC_13355 family lipoprotein [Leptospira perolatii]PJZ71177.1 hypothetical protein CH360_01275 [Leptospira perolatii]PJZ74710.1 hypothetical protein CH373_01275 [Leptospira perolatii]